MTENVKMGLILAVVFAATYAVRLWLIPEKPCVTSTSARSVSFLAGKSGVAIGNGPGAAALGRVA